MRTLTLVVVLLLCSASFSEECGEGCYTIKLNFDIEGIGYERSAIFLSGYSYGLALNEQALRKQGKVNFFCKDGDVDHKELLEMLNAKLSGVVTADIVAATAAEELTEKYPCE
jgi:hypothetical protein